MSEKRRRATYEKAQSPHSEDNAIMDQRSDTDRMKDVIADVEGTVPSSGSQGYLVLETAMPESLEEPLAALGQKVVPEVLEEQEGPKTHGPVALSGPYVLLPKAYVLPGPPFFVSSFWKGEFACGGCTYPLRQPLASAELTDGLGLPRWSDPDTIERAFHVEFQRLYRIPPDEMEPADEDRWELLLKYLDYDAYGEKNPTPVVFVGVLRRRDLRGVTVDWYDGKTETFDLRHAPAELAAAPVGQAVEALQRRFADGRVEWLITKVSTPLPSDREVWRRREKDIVPPDDLPRADWEGRED